MGCGCKQKKPEPTPTGVPPVKNTNASRSVDTLVNKLNNIYRK